MKYGILYVKNALDARPKVVEYILCSNQTHREEKAREIYNNTGRDYVECYGRFNEKKDLLLPLTTENSIIFYDYNTFYRPDLEEEEED